MHWEDPCGPNGQSLQLYDCVLMTEWRQDITGAYTKEDSEQEGGRGRSECVSLLASVHEVVYTASEKLDKTHLTQLCTGKPRWYFSHQNQSTSRNDLLLNSSHTKMQFDHSVLLAPLSLSKKKKNQNIPLTLIKTKYRLVSPTLSTHKYKVQSYGTDKKSARMWKMTVQEFERQNEANKYRLLWTCSTAHTDAFTYWIAQPPGHCSMQWVADSLVARYQTIRRFAVRPEGERKRNTVTWWLWALLFSKASRMKWSRYQPVVSDLLLPMFCLGWSWR